MTLNKKKMARLFIRYLKERGIYSPYFQNRANDRYNNKHKPPIMKAYMDDIENRIVGDACDMTQFLCYIDICFEWSKAPEGRTFWESENRFLNKCFDYPNSVDEAQKNLFNALIDGKVRKS